MIDICWGALLACWADLSVFYCSEAD